MRTRRQNKCPEVKARERAALSGASGMLVEVFEAAVYQGIMPT
jgi:hypothetical protein